MGEGFGASELLAAIDARIRLLASRPPENELGVIGPDMSLKVDRFGRAFPLGEYLVAWHLTKGWFDQFDEVEHTGGLGAVPHMHHARVAWGPGEPVSVLQPGMRVLVHWVNGGVDPVVMDVVMATGGP